MKGAFGRHGRGRGAPFLVTDRFGGDVITACRSSTALVKLAEYGSHI